MATLKPIFCEYCAAKEKQAIMAIKKRSEQIRGGVGSEKKINCD